MSRNSFFAVLCVMGSFAILSSTMSKNPTLPLFADSLGVPDHLMGFVAAASTVPGILISLPAGSLSDFFGRKRMLIISASIFASAPFLYVFVMSSWQLVLVRFYHGFATAMFVPVASAAVLDKFPENKGEKVSTFSSATLIGRGAAPFLAGYILLITSSNFSSVYVSIGMAGVAALADVDVAPLEFERAVGPDARDFANGALEKIRRDEQHQSAHEDDRERQGGEGGPAHLDGPGRRVEDRHRPVLELVLVGRERDRRGPVKRDVGGDMGWIESVPGVRVLPADEQALASTRPERPERFGHRAQLPRTGAQGGRVFRDGLVGRASLGKLGDRIARRSQPPHLLCDAAGIGPG